MCFGSRKENAVVSILSACQLVKSIALGQHIPKEGKSAIKLDCVFQLMPLR